MNGNLKAVKTGRKGDPRMHRAVSARLSNPELSLFDALRVGGFEYAADEDASIVDSEKVTLGQRKNQLSRRLRLARKTQEEGEEQSEIDMNDVAGNDRSRANAGIMSSEAQKQLEKLMQHSHTAKLTSGVKRANLDISLGDENDDDLWEAENRARRMAKFHPQYQPLFIPRAAAMKGGFSGPGQVMTPTLGSLTPTLRPLAAPLGGALAMGGGVGLGGMLPPAAAPQPSIFQQGGFLSQAMRQPRRSNGSPSGVAIASLTATAQSVGMTLEQLALSLASSTNLMKVLSNSSDSEQHQEVALRLFKNESKALYQRCMLLAGFKPEEADETSQAHLNFAFNAWQEEGKRLQGLMGEEKTVTSECINGQAVCCNQFEQAPQKQSQEDDQKDQVFVQQSGHRLSIGSSQAQCCDDEEQGCGGIGGHHVHKIDGKCGHMPIVHKPEDGEAHIDFVVGNKVECYHGVEPVNSTDKRLWRSKLKCQDMNCAPKCTMKNSAYMGNLLSNSEDDGSAKPKVLDIAEIDLQGKEWNLDITGPINGGVLGLFKLGDTKEQPNQNVNNQTNTAMRRMSTGAMMVNNPNSNAMTVLQI